VILLTDLLTEELSSHLDGEITRLEGDRRESLVAGQTDLVLGAGLLVLGGLVVAFLTLDKIGAGAGVVAGFSKLMHSHNDHFHHVVEAIDSLIVTVSEIALTHIAYSAFPLDATLRAVKKIEIPPRVRGS
jgi:SSS family solute:Na+ symporter